MIRRIEGVHLSCSRAGCGLPLLFGKPPAQRADDQTPDSAHVVGCLEETGILALFRLPAKIRSNANLRPARGKNANAISMCEYFRAGPWKQAVSKSRAADQREGEEAHMRKNKRNITTSAYSAKCSRTAPPMI